MSWQIAQHELTDKSATPSVAASSIAAPIGLGVIAAATSSSAGDRQGDDAHRSADLQARTS